MASVFAGLASVVAIDYALTYAGNASLYDAVAVYNSSLELKSGDTAFIRLGRTPSGQRRPPGWTITADEAKSLAATAKFTIENK